MFRNFLCFHANFPHTELTVNGGEEAMCCCGKNRKFWAREPTVQYTAWMEMHTQRKALISCQRNSYLLTRLGKGDSPGLLQAPLFLFFWEQVRNNHCFNLWPLDGASFVFQAWRRARRWICRRESSEVDRVSVSIMWNWEWLLSDLPASVAALWSVTAGF